MTIQEQQADVVRSRWVRRDEVLADVAAAGRDFVALLHSLAPADGDRPVPGLAWTASETAAHVVSVVRRALGDGRRAADLDELAALNATTVEEVPERDPALLAAALEADLAALAALGPTVPEDIAVPLHAGVVADIATGASYIAADLQVHGHDVASAAGREWRIDGTRAARTVLALVPATWPWIRTEVLNGPPVAVALHLHGVDEPLVVETGGGRFAVGRLAPAGARATSADGAEVLLALSGRAQPADEVLDTFARWYLPI